MQNNIMVQARSMREGARTGTRSLQGTLEGDCGMDAFGAIIQAMIAECMPSGAETGDGTLPGGGQPSEEPQKQQETTLVLDGVPQVLPLWTMQLVTIPPEEATRDAAQTQQAAEPITAAFGAPQGAQIPQTPQMQTQPVQTQPVQTADRFASQLQIERTTEQTPAARADTQPVEHTPLQFDRSVREVRQSMARDTRRSDEAPAASEPAAQRPQAAQTAAMPEKAERMEREATVFEQLKEAIPARLSQGKSEFTMRLKPEKLGEITVKLIEESGKMTLRITAASAQTARAINSDLSALREAVRPLQVEVHEAATQTGSEQVSMQQFSFSGQFANRQDAHTRQGMANTRATVASHGEEAAEEPVSRMLRAVGFDTYV